MLRQTNAKNTMTSLTIIFNQLQSKPLVCMASPLPLFWAALQIYLLICQVTPRSDSGSTSTCPWMWLKGTLPVYWAASKFDLILGFLSALAWSWQPIVFTEFKAGFDGWCFVSYMPILFPFCMFGLHTSSTTKQGFPNFLWPWSLQHFDRWAYTLKMFYD